MFTVNHAMRSVDGNWGTHNNMTDYMKHMVGLATNHWGDVAEVNGGKQFHSGEQVVAEWMPDGNLMVYQGEVFWGAAQAHRWDVDLSLLPN